jgi:hypothetical protein
MTLIRTNTPYRNRLHAGKVLSITAAAASYGRTGRLADQLGAVVPDVPSSFRAIAASTTVRVGPYTNDTNHLIEALTGTLTVDMLDEQPALPISGAPTDVVEFFGSEAPVDFVTGQDHAGIGSRYTDIVAGKLYINGGTRAQPLWKLVTSA